jgi:hypothetical protein
LRGGMASNFYAIPAADKKTYADYNRRLLSTAPKSTDVTFQNLEGKFWLVDVAEFIPALG